MWPDEVLKNQDAKAWEEVEYLFNELGAELRRVVGMKAAKDVADKSTIVLVDEADKLYIDNREHPLKDCIACIGFTATIPTGEEG